MNFLAHIYLSGDDELVKIGNFMADGIRGKDYLTLPKTVQKGILLHREIDTFTDAHPIFRVSTQRLHANFHHYSGVIVDVFYDHFLAKNWSRYSNEKLEDFVQRFYHSLQSNPEILSERTTKILPIMMHENWLVSYQTVSGIQRILHQMEYRIKHRCKLSSSVEDLTNYYVEFEEEFTAFFDELINFSRDKFLEL